MTIITAIGAFVLQSYFLNKVISWQYSLAVALVCQLLCFVVTSYWWYIAFTVAVACLFITAAYVFSIKPNAKTRTVLLWGTLVLLATTKPNIAGSVTILILITLLFSPLRIRVIQIFIAGAIPFFLLLTVIQINPLDIFSYKEMAYGRGTPSLLWFFNDKQQEYFVTIPLILFWLGLFLNKTRKIIQISTA